MQEQGAELIVALTHMRLPNDIKCAAEAVGIDLVLGGHDHDYSLDLVHQPESGRDIYVVKSGAYCSSSCHVYQQKRKSACLGITIRMPDSTCNQRVHLPASPADGVTSLL